MLSNFSTAASEMFEDTVLEWTIKEIIDEGSIFEQSIQSIPPQFSDLKTYCSSFQFHILEEMRASLKQEIEKCDFSSYNGVEYTISPGEGCTLTLSTLQLESFLSPCFGLFVPNESISSSVLVRIDSVILVKVQVPSMEPIQSNGFQRVFRCNFTFQKSSASQDFQLSFDDNGISHTWSLFLLNVTATPFSRICNALSAIVQHEGHINISLKGQLLSAQGVNMTDVGSTAVQLSQVALHRNESQQLAIQRCIKASSSGPFSAIEIVHGPPGTGKTATLVALLDSLMLHRSTGARRVWVAAPTNEAIRELAGRTYKELLQDGPDGNLEIFETVLIGDGRRLNLNQNLCLLHLQSRVDRLFGAVQHFTDTLCCLKSLTWDEYQELSEQLDQSTAQEEEMSCIQRISYLRANCTICVESGEILIKEMPHLLMPSDSRRRLKEVLNLLRRFSFELKTLTERHMQESKLIAALRDRHSSFLDELILFPSNLLSMKMPSRLRLKEIIVLGASILFSTVSTAGSSWIQRLKYDRNDFIIDIAIVDEATQLVEASTAIMLSPHLRCLVLAGDHKQLPATVISKLAEKYGFGCSLFDRLLGSNFPKSMLNIQYRMHPQISRWPNQTFYEGKLSDGDNVKSSNYVKPWHDFFPPVSIFNIRGKEESNVQGSKFNMVEVAVAVKLLKSFSSQFKETQEKPITIGIITPYSAQRELLEQHVSTLHDRTCAIRVNTVDGFQGQECDIIMFLAVRSNHDKSLGFLTDLRRLNVALTRARFSLLFICDCATLEANYVWKRLFEGATKDGKVFTHRNHDGLRAIIKNLNAELTLSLNFEGFVWAHKIWFASSFKTSIQRRNEAQRKDVFLKLFRVGDGKWPKPVRYVQNGAASPPYDDIIFVLSYGANNIIFSVDLTNHVSDGDRKLRDYSQIIMVWDCVTADKVSRILQRVRNRYRQRSSQYLELCCKKSDPPVPQSWQNLAAFDHNAPSAAMEEAEASGATEDVRDSLALIKSYALNTLHARILFKCDSSRHIELPHGVSAEEEFLITFQGSLFVVGRSGTGKTTCMLQALFRRDREYQEKKHILSDDEYGDSKYSQMMVTASPILADAIKGNYNALCDTIESATENPSTEVAAGGGQSERTSPTSNVLLETMRFDQYPSAHFPLITTFHIFLRMLDRSLEVPFFPRNEANAYLAGRARSVPVRLVDFARFDSYYLSRLGDITARKKFKIDSSTLFTEIMSVIKGSIDTLYSAVPSPLDRTHYVKLASSRGSTLSEEERNHIYDLFEDYQAIKAAASEDFDQADFVLHVHRELIKAPYSGPKLCSIMVDEVQDLTPIEIAILPQVCDNVDGFFFAGDTAQTIAHGVGFRFETLKDLFYARFVRDAPDKTFHVPEIWQLKRNYRTHKEVLKIANTVVRILLHFFPHSVDKLEDEMSVVPGPRPIFFSDTDDMISSLFDRGDMNACEFGSDQVILVRDEEMQKKLRSKLGCKALVLTVLESKGMEFSDCLVYNFFSSGGLGNMWRSIYSALPAFYDISTDSNIPRHPAFDAKLHGALQSELKKLYVLLTRTKQNLFIFESDKEVREPLQYLWRHDRIQAVVVKNFDESVKMILTASSTAEEWCARGREFRARQNHELAQQCFGRGGDEVNERLSYSDVLYVRAQKERDEKQKRKLLQDAALTCQNPPVQNYFKAGRLFSEGQYFRDAGDCFRRVQLWKDAAKCFEESKDWTSAADMFFECKHFKDFARVCCSGNLFLRCLTALDALIANDSKLSLTDLEDLRSKCTMEGADYHATKGEDIEMMKYVRLFGDIDERRDFLKRRRKFLLLASLEEEANNVINAAEIYAGAGLYQKAAHLFEKAGDQMNQLRAAQCMVKHVRKSMLDEKFLPASHTIARAKGKKNTKGKGSVQTFPISQGNRQLLEKAVGHIASSSSSCSRDEMDVHVEVEILKGHSDLRMSDYSRLKEKMDRTASSVRLNIMSVRCILRNERKVNSGTDIYVQAKATEDLVYCCEMMCKGLSNSTKAKSATEAIQPDGKENSLSQCMEMFSLVWCEASRTFFAANIAPTKLLWPESASMDQEGAGSEVCDIGVANFRTLSSKIVPFFQEVSADAIEYLVERLKTDLEKEIEYQKRLQLLLLISHSSDGIKGNSKACSLITNCRYELEGIVLPTLVTGENMRKLASARVQSQFYSCLGPLPRRDFTITYDSVVNELLLSELCWDKESTVTELQSILKGAVMNDTTFYNLNLLCNAFKNEALVGNAKVESKPRCVGFFVKSLRLMHQFLSRSIQEPSRSGKPLTVSDGKNVSPFKFLALAEKSVVFLVLCMKRFHNVLLPLSLAMDILHRPNASLSKIIECAQAAGGDLEKFGFIDRKTCLNWIYDVLITALSTFCPEISHLPYQNRHDYCVRLLGLALSAVMNLDVSAPARSEVIHRIGCCAPFLRQSDFVKKGSRSLKQLVQFLGNIHPGIDNFSELLTIYNSLETPVICVCVDPDRIQPRLAPSMRVEKYIATVQPAALGSCITLMPFKLYPVGGDNVQIRENLDPLPLQAGGNAWNTRCRMDVDAPAFVPQSDTGGKSPQQVTHWEERQRNIIIMKYRIPLLTLAEQARKRVSQFTPLDIQIRSVEKTFLAACDESGKPVYHRIHPKVVQFNKIISPLVLEVQSALGTMDQCLQKIRKKRAKSRLLDRAYDASGALEKALKNSAPERFLQATLEDIEATATHLEDTLWSARAFLSEPGV